MSQTDEIRNAIGSCEVLAQLAEEAAELAQAALKLRRAIDGSNPTPVQEEKAWEDLEEEIGDVMLCLQVLGRDKLTPTIESMMHRKKERWQRRIRGSEKLE